MPASSSPWTVLRMIEWGTEYFANKDIPSPRLSIEWLLADVLATKRLNLYVQFDRPLSSVELKILRSMVKRRGNSEPLQYITGSTDFYNATISVNKSVLIPRPETEELVDLILQNHPPEKLRVLDIGTGSGCIPISLAMERPNWELMGVDISEDALKTASVNNELNGTKVSFARGDLHKHATLPDQHWDIIVSNPPYIEFEESAELDRQVSEFEPEIALFCEDRSKTYNDIGKYAEKTLVQNGRLYLELHAYQSVGDEINFAPEIWDVQVINDSSNRQRFIEAKVKK